MPQRSPQKVALVSPKDRKRSQPLIFLGTTQMTKNGHPLLWRAIKLANGYANGCFRWCAIQKLLPTRISDLRLKATRSCEASGCRHLQEQDGQASWNVFWRNFTEKRKMKSFCMLLCFAMLPQCRFHQYVHARWPFP